LTATADTALKAAWEGDWYFTSLLDYLAGESYHARHPFPRGAPVTVGIKWRMTKPLTEAETDRLEEFLNAAERIEDTLPLDTVQGLFAAIAGTEVARERWLPEVLGEGHAFASKEEEGAITGLLERFREDTKRQLDEGGGFDFILYGPDGEEEDFAPWAQGYLIGVDLFEPPWDEVLEAEDLDNMLFPFLALTGQAKEMALESGEEWMSDAEEAKMLAEIRAGFADHLFEVRRYWFDRSIPPTVKRESPKVGRNDPCPCGSGKKYKGCHGK